MNLVRVGMALGLTATVLGTAWAIPGGEGLGQLRVRESGQSVQPEEVGLQAMPSGRSTRYICAAPGFEISLPSDWRIYRPERAAPAGMVGFIAGGDATSDGSIDRWPDGTPRPPRRPGTRALAPERANGLVATIGERVSDRELQELRAFATRSRRVPADGRMVEVYSYRLVGAEPKSIYNVSVATTIARDAGPGRVDFKLIYYPRATESDGMDRLMAIARTFRTVATVEAPAAPAETAPAAPAGDGS